MAREIRLIEDFVVVRAMVCIDEALVSKKAPKAVMLAREALKMLNLEVTGDNLKAVLNPKELNVLATAIRSSMSEQVKSDYKKLNTDEERRQWIAQFVLDPTISTTEGFNGTLAYKQEGTIDEDVWLTEEQLGSASYLNSVSQASQIVKVGELESRPHELACLAQAGIKQYKYTTSVVRRENGLREEAGTSAKAELNDNEYEEVTKEMKQGFGKPVKRRQPKQKEPESDEQKKLKSATQLRASNIRKCKVMMDKAATDAVACEGDLQKLVTKGYPGAMIDWFKNLVGEFKAEVEVARVRYAKEATRVEAGKPNCDEVEANTMEVDLTMHALDSKYKAFKEGVFTDVKKLSG